MVCIFNMMVYLVGTISVVVRQRKQLLPDSNSSMHHFSFAKSFTYGFSGSQEVLFLCVTLDDPETSLIPEL